jgi:glycosyltransferase involved in cell wall biosynthesis
MKQKFKKSKPIISIITPTYNASRFIEKTVYSIKNQSFSLWELIIVDDFSEDNCMQLLREFGKKDKRIKIISLSQNYGAWKARNIGIKESSARYIAFLDSDDMWHSKKLEMQLAFMTKNKYSLTYTNYAKINELDSIIDHIELPKKLDYRKMLKSNFMPCLTVMYDTKYFGKQYMPPLRKRQDYGL